MKIMHWTASLLVLTLVACSQAPSDDSAEGEVGTLQLALGGVDGQMQQYRLRSAVFDIQGTRYTDYQYVQSTISTESAPDIDAAVLSAQLFHGSYSVSLQPDGWYLERITEDGAEPVEHAVLLTTEPQWVGIGAGSVSRVAFQFGVDGELIDFFGGELEIGIEIQNAPGSAGAGE